jgi:hypothetical protein
VYKPTPNFGQLRTDRWEPLDVVRLGPGQTPLSGEQLASFWNLVHAVTPSRLDNGQYVFKTSDLKFYEKYGVMHFVYMKTCGTYLVNGYRRSGCQNQAGGGGRLGDSRPSRAEHVE